VEIRWSARLGQQENRAQDAEKVRERKKTVIWFVWFVLFIWLNQMNQIDQTNQSV